MGERNIEEMKLWIFYTSDSSWEHRNGQPVEELRAVEDVVRIRFNDGTEKDASKKELRSLSDV